MKRKLFCEWSPLTYKISVEKEILFRKIRDRFSSLTFAKASQPTPLPVLVYKHKSLIRRKLHNVNLELQENKAVSLTLAAPKINHIIIRPNETFSFWKLVGRCTKQRGYKVGLTISNNKIASGIGGGMCQFTNLIHWMILHSPLDIIEHHHHNRFDLFPDVGRQIPFGTGTSICYNYLDYRFTNNTPYTFQLITYVTDEHLCGELRSCEAMPNKYHIKEEDAYFYKDDYDLYRHNKIYRDVILKNSGKLLNHELLLENHAKVMYDHSFIASENIKQH